MKYIAILTALISLVFFTYGVSIDISTAFHQIYQAIVVGLSSVVFMLSLLLFGMYRKNNSNTSE